MTATDAADETGRARRRITLRHRLEYAGLRAFAAFINVAGLRAGYVLAPAISRFYTFFDQGHVRVATDNIRLGFGLDEPAARRLALDSYRHFFKCAVEILLLDRNVEKHGFEEIITTEGAEHVERGLAAGKGVIICTGHLGNWEVIARIVSARNWKVTTVYRPLDNPLIDDWIRSFRSAHDQVLQLKRGALKAMLGAIRKGDIAVLMVDQDARRRGVFAPFLGRPASTIRTPADLALRTGAAMITAFAARTGPGFRHHVRFDPPVDTSSSGDRDADVTRIMTDVNKRLEAALRRAPEQWLWMHRRWKTVQKQGESRPA